MAAVWELDGLDPYERLIMLALSDHADDEGRCYPSVARLAARSGMSERGVQNAITRLIDKGFVSVILNGGKRGANLYIVSPEPTRKQPEPPHPVHPRTECTPAPGAPHPRTRCTPTPAPGAPEPSFNHQEPPVKNKTREAKKPDEVSEALLAWASPQSVASFISYRKRHKAKALTPTGAKRLAGHLQEIFNAGGDCDDALAMIEEKGWASIEPDWFFKAKGQVTNGRPAKPSVDRTLLQIADGLSAGTVSLDYSNRNPFAAR